MQSSVASDDDRRILELALSIEDGWDFRNGVPDSLLGLGVGK